MPELTVEIAPSLRFLLPRARRGERMEVRCPDTDSVGHLVQSLGIPLTEVGDLWLNDAPVRSTERVASGRLRVRPVARPQRTTTTPPRFLLDVHLGGLARRLRLLGLDVAYSPDADDARLAERAAAEHRVLLTQDRGLLQRRALPEGALIREAGTERQLEEVLDRFAPPLEPWTRCLRCGGRLTPTSAADVADQLEPGTRRTYGEFSRCEHCGRAYWRGAHAAPLEAIIARAKNVVARRLAATEDPRPGS